MKTYVVTGDRRVFGVEPGQTVQRELTPELERRLTKAGRIKPAPPVVNQEEEYNG